MCKYLLDLIGINLDEPLVGYEDSKLKLSITIIFQNLTLPWDEKEKYRSCRSVFCILTMKQANSKYQRPLNFHSQNELIRFQ